MIDAVSFSTIVFAVLKDSFLNEFNFYVWRDIATLICFKMTFVCVVLNFFLPSHNLLE